jgi:Winged helix DNA-binding domain
VILSTRRLNRALLARQLLLERSRLPLGRALERVGGLQAQYAPSPYIRLWSMLDVFELGDLTRALELKRVVQGTLMRSTIHIVSPRDYWHFAAGVGPSRQEWWLRTWGRNVPDVNLDDTARELRDALAGRTWHRKELDALLREKSSTIWSGAWIPVVRLPPSGTWEHRRADLFRLASEWLVPEDVNEDDGLEHLLRHYLAAFGPTTLADAADWAGVARAKLVRIAERVQLRTFRDEDGRELLDLPRAPLPTEDRPAPVRFLGTWDAVLLVHVRRTQILPERFRPLVFSTKNPQSVATFLVDGSVAGAWRVERTKQKATLRLEPFEALPGGARRELRDEGERLVRFHEPDAMSYTVR